MSSWDFDLRGYIEEEVKKAIEKHLGEMVSVVRCKECRHREEYMCRGIDDDFFCADGERRD